MKIVNPGFRRITEKEFVAAGHASPSPRQSVCMFSNSKPNATALLNGIRQALVRDGSAEEIGQVNKLRASVGASKDELDQVSRHYGMAVVAIAD